MGDVGADFPPLCKPETTRSSCWKKVEVSSSRPSKLTWEMKLREEERKTFDWSSYRLRHEGKRVLRWRI